MAPVERCKWADCAFKGIPYRLRKHVREVHNLIRPFQCRECDFKAKRKYALGEHEKTHLKGMKREESYWKCGRCRYVTQYKSKLTRHTRMHTLTDSKKAKEQNQHVTSDEELIICKICGFETSDGRTGALHNNSHGLPRLVIRRLKKTKENDVRSNSCVVELSVSMNGRDLYEHVKNTFSVLDGCRSIPIAESRKDRAKPAMTGKNKITEDQRFVPTPNVVVETSTEAMSNEVQEICNRNAIAVVRGMATAVKINMDLFTTKTLGKVNPDHCVEVRTQWRQLSDDNRDVNGKSVWLCESQRSESTIAEYGAYQATSFLEYCKEQAENWYCMDNVKWGWENDVNKLNDNHNSRQTGRRKIKFGTNVDLSDESKWRSQLEELEKLPDWAKYRSSENMLTHVGHEILGMNTVQLYMKVAGSRTPGHQENNNFCSVNVNIGPGDCEWFAVANECWSSVQRLCTKNKIKYLHGSWWPNLNDLFDAGCPVFRFVQRPGDLVWVNIGCVHWVQAIGVCNNIAWNVGPMTALQFEIAMERYEWNKVQMYKSIVPMMKLTWNLARNVRVKDPPLVDLIRCVLMQSLVRCIRIIEWVKCKNVEVQFYGRSKESHYCVKCEVELFSILFIRKQDKTRVVYCFDCARNRKGNLNGFVCLEEYKLEELIIVYDNFRINRSKDVKERLQQS